MLSMLLIFFKIVSLKDEIAMLKKLRCVWFAAHDTEGQPFSGNELGGGGVVYKAENYKNGWNLGKKSV